MNTMNGEKIKVMVVDDHPLLRVGITAIVNARSDMTVVAQAETGEEAVNMFPRCKPDVTLMDLKLRGMNGVATIEAILADHPSARFIVVTTYEGDEDIHRALEAGAQGYIIKGMPYQVLVQALQRVHSGGRFLPPPVVHALASRMPDSDLSARELEILRLLAAGNSMTQIAHVLNVSYKTVANNCTALKHKLGARSAMDLMRIAVDSTTSSNHRAR